MPRASLRIVPPRICTETVEALERWLNEARRGDLVGLACVKIYRTHYRPELAGQARQRPTLTRGMVGALEDAVREEVEGPTR